MIEGKRQGKSISRRVILVTSIGVFSLALMLVFIMIYFMTSLTDSMALDILQPTAQTAAKGIEANLHTMADRLLLMRQNTCFTGEVVIQEDCQQQLDMYASGVEFVWLGLYRAGGSLYTGSEGCPRSIYGRELYAMISQTANLSIEDITVGQNGLEIAMGVPISGLSSGAGELFLVGSYKYDVLDDVLKSINIGDDSTAFIIDGDGGIIAHRDPGLVYGQQNLRSLWGRNAAGLIEQMETSQIGAGSIRTDEGLQYVSYAPIRGTRWSLGVQVPAATFSVARNQAILISLIVTCVLLLLFALAFWTFMKRIVTDPLGAITSSAHALARGTLEQALPGHLAGREDEIGQLATAFVTMSSTIEAVIGCIGRLNLSVLSGHLLTRENAAPFDGDYHRIIEGMNATLDVFCRHLDTIPGALALFNSDRRLLYSNATMRMALGRHGLTGDEGVLEALVCDERGDLLPEVAELFAAGASTSQDTCRLSRAMKDAQGGVTNYAVTLRRTIIELEEERDDFCVLLVMSDTTDLTRAKEGAEHANRAKSNFLSSMSHEMRTPMNAIIGMTAIAKSSDSIAQKDYCLGKIDDASKHLLGVINDILDMSKIEADKFELSFAEFNFERMLQKVVNVITFRVEEKEQQFHIKVDSSIPPVLIGDDQRIAQVITNLLGNAVKFTPQGGMIRLEAGLISRDGSECVLKITIADTGIGISREQQAQLFQSFVQADNTTARRFGGTGLGLAISKRIVAMMDGEIWVESELGKGSEFSFTIRLTAGNLGSGMLGSPQVEWAKLTVLVVDDDHEQLEYFQSIATRLGVGSLSVALSGEEACTVIEEKGPFDLYFIDWKMPGMNGIELSRHIKTREEQARIVMITAAELSRIESEARNAGVEHFLSKPLFASIVADCVNECIGSGYIQTAQDDDITGCFAGHRILLVEDVEINREIVLALLEPTELVIDCAENGVQAVDMFKKNPSLYEMIFMDIHMPEMDGYEATRTIRMLPDPAAAQIPIVAMTANVFREDIEKCLDAGMNAHVGKPLDFGDVMDKLSRYLG